LAIKSVVLPVLTGGAIAMGALVVTSVRRAFLARSRSSERRTRIESDPIGLRDGEEAMPERPIPSKVHTEAEAAAAAGVGWLPSLESVEPASERSDQLAPNSMSEPLLDFDIEFDDSDSGISARVNEMLGEVEEQYDAVDPDSLATEWLLRATEAPRTATSAPLDDISEVPTESNPWMSEASTRAAEFNEDEVAPTQPGSRLAREEEFEDVETESLWDSTRAPEDAAKGK